MPPKIRKLIAESNATVLPIAAERQVIEIYKDDETPLPKPKEVVFETA
jgi:hypothetical protein